MAADAFRRHRTAGIAARASCRPTRPELRHRSRPGSLPTVCRSRNTWRSVGRIEIEFTIQTCGNSPLSQRRQTVALHTPKCMFRAIAIAGSTAS